MTLKEKRNGNMKSMKITLDKFNALIIINLKYYLIVMGYLLLVTSIKGTLLIIIK